ISSRVSGVTRLVAGCLIIAALMTAVLALQVVREQRVPQPEAVRQTLSVSSPAVMTRLALSYDAVFADLYWIRAVQYYGSTRLSDRPRKTDEALPPLPALPHRLAPNI